MHKGIALIKDHLLTIQKFAQVEKEIFSDPRANFRQLKDVSNQGYVTFVAHEDSIREILIDSTETSPTFSTNPIPRENETHKKRAEYQPYLMGQETGGNAWKALLGRDVKPSDQKDTEAFLLGCEEEGINSFSKRPRNKGSFLVGVKKIKGYEYISGNMSEILRTSQKQGADIGLILICRDKLFDVQKKELETYRNVLVIEDVPSDALGISETIILKQVLNLISNSAMILMNKVHGNQMIDVRASNKKLIDRCIRLIKDIWAEYQPDIILDNKRIYHLIAHVSILKKSHEEKGIYTPAIVKIVLAMIALKKTPDNFQEVIDYLAERQERIDWIGLV